MERRRKHLFALASPLLVTTMLAIGACAATPAEPPATANPAPGSCDASKAQFAIGHDAGLAIQDQARERSGAGVVRTVRPGQIITMEFRADRLTLELDASGKVTRVRCG
ncbi:I78 family peptidase inhibitor [Caenimonas terrae]|uniref:I78 family peptidase inhibitor n=1 Tax=Caenimonas terrae TaxID=696074 RepID=A0ABW0NIX8_9BURK